MLYLNLIQFPLDFFFKKLGNYQFIKNIRNEFIFQKEGLITNKERLIRLLLPEMIPTLYIEGFSSLQKIVKKHNLPNKQINIYTCNAWNDTIFKFWLSEKINNGSKLIYGQHGAGYGLTKKYIGDTHDRKISDKFITWGQEYNKDKKNISGIVQSVIEYKKKSFFSINKNKITLVTTVSDIYLYRNEIKDPNLLATDLNNIAYFINKIYDVFKNKLIVKIHPLEYKKSFSYFNYLQNKNKSIKIVTKEMSLQKLMEQSRISIFFYLGTDFLKNLAIMRPSIMIMTKQLQNILTHEANEFFEDMAKAKVIFYNYEEAAEFIINNYQNMDRWWLDSYTQTQIKKFTTTKNPKTHLKNCSNSSRL